MQIANPIYDVVFKYLMEDSKIARLLISTIIGEEIVELDFQPQESSAEVEQRSLTVYRLDFSAKIKTPDGYKIVLIEIQKAKFATDIMRFRKYLGLQYAKKENVRNVTINGKETKIALPILNIYFLGHRIGHTDAPLIKVNRHYYDVRTGNVIKEKIDFIESLSHDSFIIQVPHLRKKYKTEVEQLLSVFDQHNITSDCHILNVREEDFSEKYHPIIRRLQIAIAEPEVRTTMNIEDEILEELQGKEREIARKENVIEEKENVIEEKDKVIKEKDLELEQQRKEIEYLRNRNKNI